MKGVPPTATIINNVSIGLLPAQRFSRTRSKCRAIRNSSARKKNRAHRRVEQSCAADLTSIGLSAGLEVRDERLRRIDEAMARIDTDLTTCFRTPPPPAVRCSFA